MAFMYQHSEAFESRVQGGGPQKCSDWWQAAKRSPWYEDHPCREHVEHSASEIIPIRLYGDDAKYQSQRQALVLTWSCMYCRLPSLLSRFLITLLPLRHAVGATHRALYKVITWSLAVMLTGVMPKEDHRGQAWPSTSWRAVHSGRLIAGGKRAAVVQILGDWKWLKETVMQFLKWGFQAEA